MSYTDISSRTHFDLVSELNYGTDDAPTEKRTDSQCEAHSVTDIVTDTTWIPGFSRPVIWFAVMIGVTCHFSHDCELNYGS